MDAQARTMDRILHTANQQLELMNAALISQTSQNHMLLQQLALRDQLARDQAPTVPPELIAQAVQMIPSLLQALIHKATPAASAAAVNGASAPLNNK
jgi:hypothetical protein